MPSAYNSPLRRLLLGIFALILLATGLVLQFAAPASWPSHAFAGHFLRGGLLVSVLWLALPDTESMRNRIWLGAVLLVAVVMVSRPSLLKFLLPPLVVTLVLYKIFKPRQSKRGRMP